MTFSWRLRIRLSLYLFIAKPCKRAFSQKMNYLLMVTELKAGTSNFGCTQLVLPHGVGVERSPMWYLPSSCSLPWYHLSSQPSDPISPPLLREATGRCWERTLARHGAMAARPPSRQQRGCSGAQRPGYAVREVVKCSSDTVLFSMAHEV